MTGSLQAVVRCGDVVIDVRQECVRRRGIEQRLRLKSFHVLLYLIQNRHRVVSKGELFDTIWNGVAVTEDTLVQSIVEIRRALADDPRAPQFIRTLPKSGYRFVADVDDEPPAAVVEYESVQRIELELTEDEQEPARSPVRVAWIIAAAIVVAVASIELIRTRSGFAGVQADHSANIASDRVIDAMTTNLEAYKFYTFGVSRAQQYHETEAIAAFQRAIALDSAFAMAYARIGYAYGVTSASPDRGRPYLDRALALHDRLSERDRYYVEAWHAIVDKHYESAIEIFRTLLTRYPTEIEAHYHLGLLLASEERLDEAVGVLEHARLIDPSAPQVQNILGGLYREQRRIDDALAAHQRCVSLAPDEPNMHDSLALTWQAAGQYEKALGEYDAALQLDPGFQIARIHRGNTLYQMGRYREAIHDFQNVIHRAVSTAESARGYESVAWVLRSKGDLAAAEAAARTAKAIDPGAVSALMVISADRGDIATARELMNRYNASLHPARGSRSTLRFSYFYNGYVSLKGGHADQAIDLFRHAVQSLPPLYSVDTLDDCLADGYLSLGRYANAAREYESVLRSDPSHALSHFNLADVYDRLGRKADAEREYRAFVEIWKGADPDLPQIILARKRLATS